MHPILSKLSDFYTQCQTKLPRNHVPFNYSAQHIPISGADLASLRGAVKPPKLKKNETQ